MGAGWMGRPSPRQRPGSVIAELVVYDGGHVEVWTRDGMETVDMAGLLLQVATGFAKAGTDVPGAAVRVQ